MREYAGGRPSQSSVARRPSPCTPTLLGTEVILRCCVCCVVDFCLYAAVLKMERCADLVSVFFGTYSGTPCRSGPCILRYLWWYAEPGCCGGGVITTWAAGDGVIAAEPAVWAEGEFCTWRSLWSLSQRWPSSALYLPQKFPDTPNSHPHNHV